MTSSSSEDKLIYKSFTKRTQTQAEDFDSNTVQRSEFKIIGFLQLLLFGEFIPFFFSNLESNYELNT